MPLQDEVPYPHDLWMLDEPCSCLPLPPRLRCHRLFVPERSPPGEPPVTHPAGDKLPRSPSACDSRCCGCRAGFLPGHDRRGLWPWRAPGESACGAGPRPGVLPGHLPAPHRWVTWPGPGRPRRRGCSISPCARSLASAPPRCPREPNARLVPGRRQHADSAAVPDVAAHRGAGPWPAPLATLGYQPHLRP